MTISGNIIIDLSELHKTTERVAYLKFMMNNTEKGVEWDDDTLKEHDDLENKRISIQEEMSKYYKK